MFIKPYLAPYKGALCNGLIKDFNLAFLGLLFYSKFSKRFANRRNVSVKDVDLTLKAMQFAFLISAKASVFLRVTSFLELGLK